MGFEEALRTSHWAALEWWFYELPELANRAPPSRGAQMTWVPLQRVLLPGYLANPETQADTVRFLLAHGADPRSKLPFDGGKNVIAFAAAIKSPMLALLDEPARAMPVPATTLAQTAADADGGRAGGVSRPARQAARFDPKSPTNDTTPR